jgi:hypothetical protein
MTSKVIIVIWTSLLLVGCHSQTQKAAPQDQWVLEHYDLQQGYTFTKGGLIYRAKCSHFLIADRWEARKPEDNSDCASILEVFGQPLQINADKD